MIDAYKGGATLEEISVTHGLSRERIRQLIRGAGVTYQLSGRHQQILSNTAKREAKRMQGREARCLRMFGCSVQTYRQFAEGDYGKRSRIANSYLAHKKNVTRFGMDWSLSLPEYAELVGPHIDEIGRGRMTLCRLDKRGPFSKANLSIASQSDNSKLTNGFSKGRAKGNAVNSSRAAERRRKTLALEAEGVSREDIAKRVKISLSSVNSYIYRARNGKQ